MIMTELLFLKIKPQSNVNFLQHNYKRHSLEHIHYLIIIKYYTLGRDKRKFRERKIITATL
jgi:hypothetical protein